MLREYTLLPVTAVAGLIAGAGTPTFFAAALAATAAVWLSRRHGPSSLCFATLDPRKPDAMIILDALRRTLDLMSQSGLPVRLRLATFASDTHTDLLLMLNSEGDVVLATPSRAVALGRPGVWLADHPLPFPLTDARSVTLVFKPCGTCRVRVSLPSPSACRSGQWVLLALLAALACVLDKGWLLAGTLGFAFQSYLLEHQTERSTQNVKIHCH